MQITVPAIPVGVAVVVHCMRIKPLSPRSLIFIASALIVAVSLSACGGSSKSQTASSSKTPSSTTSSSSSKGAAKPVVTTKKDAKFGTILADDKGLTLYTLTNNARPVTCTGPCETVWPPLEMPTGIASPTGAPGVTGLTAVAGPDGKQLVAASGLPLYRFVKDKDPGDSYGDGIQSFGGVWHVVTTAGKTKTNATNSDSSTTPTTSKSGY